LFHDYRDAGGENTADLEAGLYTSYPL